MINADEIIIGYGSFISPSAIIRGTNGNAQKIIIGDNCYIGNDVQIICNNFSIGDYSKIHNHVTIHGNKPCEIGHNAWIGQYTIIDTSGGVTIGDNFGIGAHSQLWSHIKYGDTLEGCRFLNCKKIEIGNDVWFVGHCIISPIKAADKSMALAGSVITHDMVYNTIYAGSPAKSVSEKIGLQFNEIDVETKFIKMNEYLNESKINSTSIKIKKTKAECNFDSATTYFVIEDRKYNKNLSKEEIEFMKFLLPEKAKFTPY
jgi:acetyltransferase-like isoleucine patch superfamily enzyme